MSPLTNSQNALDQNLKCYVMVNSQLPAIHAGIQASHSLTELVFFNRDEPNMIDWVKNHKTLILLSATDKEITQMKEYFDLKNIRYASFSEPDLNNLETAVAFMPMTSLEGTAIFGKFKLYK